MEIYANLHNHTTHSDGPISPTQLVELAKSEGYGAVAVTDHDTATAFPELCAACERLGLECIFGVEFTVQDPAPYHILGFNLDPEYPEMKAYLADMAKRQTDNTKCCFDEAVENGGITGITWDEVLEFNKGIAWLCNNHVFELLKAKGLVKQSEYMSWFNKNFLHQRSKYPPKFSPKPLPELVSLIKAAGGIALVAHPHCQLDDIDDLISAGIEGLEVCHPDLTKEEQERALAIALEKRLFIGGGSDHSGICGGYYSSFASEEELHASFCYIEPMSAGTSREYFEEIKNSKINR